MAFQPLCQHGFFWELCPTCSFMQTSFGPSPVSTNHVSQDSYVLNMLSCCPHGTLEQHLCPFCLGMLASSYQQPIAWINNLGNGSDSSLSGFQSQTRPTEIGGIPAATTPLKCDPCSKSFSSKGDLDRHVREQHTNPKRFLCPVLPCDRGMRGHGFARRDQLVNHLTSSKHKMGYDEAKLAAARHNQDANAA
ncbi:hypothetical protein EDD36DRAFT_418157 [Exophiala viscosa]|uniref:C2H2-type domain-containing protein n=1 Tax=Exophiala viscosa TaxID=2486360 RepID=A0AAN6IDW2_9EURO|nr:hypothetical protein EDD36DRAFT_418157 [Exophiala viscosa]